jgi:glycosyltransferase involved in cell wall biosynthesis
MSSISIIIPTLNRAHTLAKTLNSILNQKQLKTVEVIVVDNGSNDNTANIFDDFAKACTFPCFYYYDAEPGLLTGRHRGALAAKGDILCFLDDDVELSDGWLIGVREAFEDASVQLATGPCLPMYEIAPPKWLKYFWDSAYGGKFCAWLSLIDLGQKKIEVHPNYVFGLNFCIRKSILFELGGFHPDCITAHLQMYQGDGETGLTFKAAKLKLKSLYHPGIKVSHIIAPERLTIEYFKQRAFYQGVCNSFTTQRRLLEGNEKMTIRYLLSQILGRVKKVFTINKGKMPNEILMLLEMLKNEEKKGHDFHQNAFIHNKKVREWVQKKDYWDYKLPV